MTAAEVIKAELVSLCPAFATVWITECELRTSEDGSYTVHGVFAAFSHYIAGRLKLGIDPDLPKVFEYVESKLTDVDAEIDNAICTCFLENLMNSVPETIPPQKLVPFLGPKSRQFCRAWDEWCGVKTEGLW